MNKIVTVDEMQAIERDADALGLSYIQMMENAGNSLARAVQNAYSHLPDRSVLALVGTGNNGGDALVALSTLVDYGWRISAYIVLDRPQGDVLLARVSARNGGVWYAEQDPDFEKLNNLLDTHTVLLDGVLGTGVRLPLRGRISACLSHVQHYLAVDHDRLHVVAVDCPSGVDCALGRVADEALHAEMTVSMAAIKQGLLSLPAADYIGAISIGAIGNLENLERWKNIKRWVAEPAWVAQSLPKRSRAAHKGTFGTAMIVAGSRNYTGASLLAGKAAARSGVGMVHLVVPDILHPVLAGTFPEAIWTLLPSENGVIASSAAGEAENGLSKVTAALIGPGLGMQPTTQVFIHNLFMTTIKESVFPPLVVDADGLKLLQSIPNWHEKLPGTAILTPHPGEMSILTGLPIGQIQEKRIQTAETFSQRWGHVVVLKGAYTVVASPDGRCIVIPVATPALAKAGTGDVLAGIIVGLLAQGVQSFEAAVCGAWVHAQAGLKVEMKYGAASSLAGDILEMLADTLKDLGGFVQ